MFSSPKYGPARGSNFVGRLVFFIGWMLSPLTFWNDAFVNIPLSYICAILFAKIIPINFSYLVLASYWLSNIFGIALMYAAGKRMFRKGRVLREILNLIIAIAVYSIMIILLNNTGILDFVRK